MGKVLLVQTEFLVKRNEGERERKRRKSALPGTACSSGVRLFTWVHWGWAVA